MKIATGFGFGAKIAEVERPKSDTTTGIECTTCDTIFYSIHFSPKNAADTCECRNMRISVVNIVPGQKANKKTYHLQLIVENRSTVKIYSVHQKNFKRVQPEKVY